MNEDETPRRGIRTLGRAERRAVEEEERRAAAEALALLMKHAVATVPAHIFDTATKQGKDKAHERHRRQFRCQTVRKL